MSCARRSTPSSAFPRLWNPECSGPLGAEKYSEYCTDIRGSGQYLLEVINDILDMSKIEAGRIRLEFEDLDLDTLLGESMRVVAARAQDKQLQVNSRIAPELKLRGDRRAIKTDCAQSVGRMAVKFTPAGGRIVVRGRTADDYVTLAIADTGIGIAKDALTRLGRPFEQVESPVLQEPPGFRPRAGDCQIVGRVAWRPHAHPLGAGQRHAGRGAACRSIRNAPCRRKKTA